MKNRFCIGLIAAAAAGAAWANYEWRGATGDFASSNLPNGWLVRYDSDQHKLVLYFQRGTVFMVR